MSDKDRERVINQIEDKYKRDSSISHSELLNLNSGSLGEEEFKSFLTLLIEVEVLTIREFGEEETYDFNKSRAREYF